MKYIKKFIKWLRRNKKRRYKFQYRARGYMGNSYIAGTYEITVSDKRLKEWEKSPVQYCFSMNLDALEKHYTKRNGGFAYRYLELTKELV